MKTLIYDIDRDIIVDGSGQKWPSQIKLAYEDYTIWRLYFGTVDGGTVTYVNLALLGITQMRGAVANDYVHGVVNGALTAATSGIVTTITADGFATGPPPVGIFRMTNTTGDYEDVAYAGYTGTWENSASVLTFAVTTTLAYYIS